MSCIVIITVKFLVYPFTNVNGLLKFFYLFGINYMIFMYGDKVKRFQPRLQLMLNSGQEAFE